MKYFGTRLATGLAVMGLAGTLFAAPALAQSSPGAQTTTTTSLTKRSAACTAVRQRLADSPQIFTRIDTNLDRLNAELDKVRLPARRAALEVRIERLEALRTDLAQKIADARRACGAGVTPPADQAPHRLAGTARPVVESPT